MHGCVGVTSFAVYRCARLYSMCETEHLIFSIFPHLWLSCSDRSFSFTNLFLFTPVSQLHYIYMRISQSLPLNSMQKSNSGDLLQHFLNINDRLIQNALSDLEAVVNNKMAHNPGRKSQQINLFKESFFSVLCFFAV